jgi:hypothetical protein
MVPTPLGSGTAELVDQAPQQGHLVLDVLPELDRVGAMLLDLLVVQGLFQ